MANSRAREFVGKVDDRDDFLIAVLVEGEGPDRTVEAYVCTEAEDATAFFPATPAPGDALTLESEDGLAQVQVTLAGRRDGTVTLDGKERPFTTRPAKGLGGLYEWRFAADGTFTGKDPVSGATTEAGPAPRRQATSRSSTRCARATPRPTASRWLSGRASPP